MSIHRDCASCLRYTASIVERSSPPRSRKDSCHNFPPAIHVPYLVIRRLLASASKGSAALAPPRPQHRISADGGRELKGFRLCGGCALAACAVLAVALPVCAAQQARPSPQSTPPARTEQSAGGKIFDKWCRDCHAEGGPGSRALQRKYQGAVPAVLEQRNNLPPDYVKLVVRRGISFMPSFRKTEISDNELTLVAAYLAPPQ